MRQAWAECTKKVNLDAALSRHSNASVCAQSTCKVVGQRHAQRKKSKARHP